MSDTQPEPPDDDLIQMIRRKDDAAQSAFATFYRRHIQFLFRCVRHADKQLVGYGLGTADIVEETFANVWHSGANSYCASSGLSAEAASARTRQWLATIARNLVKDKLRSRQHQLPIDPTGENEALFATEEVPCPATRHIQLIQVVSAVLSQRDAAIVWFKMRYYDPETQQSQPPPKELDAFCKEWAISPAALRKAYERALATLSQALSRSSVAHE